MPLSDTGVSQRFSTCSFCRCSLIICRPASPNCVAHRFKYLNAGNFISCSAHADVTEVKARLRHSRLPRARPPSRRATSASVARTGSVSFRGPPFCCWQKYIHGTTLEQSASSTLVQKKKERVRTARAEGDDRFVGAVRELAYQFLQVLLPLAESGVMLLPGFRGLERVDYLKPRLLVRQ